MLSVGPRRAWFTPDGRVLEIEHAEAATGRGAPIVGIVYPQGVLLAAAYAPTGSDLVPTPVEGNGSELRGGKIVRLGPRLAIAGVGLQGDFAAVSRVMRRIRPKSLRDASDTLGHLFWIHTTRAELRPLGTMVLMGSTLDGEPRLLRFSPSGSIHEYTRDVWGFGAEAVREGLRRAGRPRDLAAAKVLALAVLKSPTCEMVHLEVAG